MVMPSASLVPISDTDMQLENIRADDTKAIKAVIHADGNIAFQNFALPTTKCYIFNSQIEYLEDYSYEFHRILIVK